MRRCMMRKNVALDDSLVEEHSGMLKTSIPKRI
jgi:Arc/MetJ family transcription regulator